MQPHRFLLAGVLALAAAPVTAQTNAPLSIGRVWLDVGRAGGGRVAIDSGTVQRTADSTFIAATLVEFTDTLAAQSGQRFDREVDLQELHCDGQRIRSFRSILLLGDSAVFDASVPTGWQRVPEPQLALFQARCAFLLASFGAAPLAFLDVSDVEERPMLTNASRVMSLIQELAPETGPGTVVVSFVVDEAGLAVAGTLSVVTTDLANAAQARQVAQRVVDRMRFRAARIGRRPVKVRVQLPITFQAS